MPRLLLYIFFYLLSFSAIAQTRNYDVLLGSKKVGSVVSSKLKSADLVTYKTVFKIKLRVFKMYNIESITTSTYRGNILLSSNFKIYDGGVLEEENSIKKEQSNYRCTDCKDKPIVVKELIRSNISKVYFEEPTATKKVYTDRYMGFGIMTALGNHKYKFKMPNGDENIYTYKNGTIETIYISRLFYNLTFKYID